MTTKAKPITPAEAKVIRAALRSVRLNDSYSATNRASTWKRYVEARLDFDAAVRALERERAGRRER